MRGTVLYGTRDIRFEEVSEPKIIKPTDAIIRLEATCVCGSDLWSYRGISPVSQPTPMGHEYCGIVEEVGNAVKTVKPGQFVIGSFFASDSTCPHCNFGYQSSCQQREFVGGAQAPLLRVPLADGTLVPTSGVPAKEMVPNLLATSDVLGTGWFAADAAKVKPGMTVVVVGDGAVGLLAVLSARQRGAERIIAMSRHKKRQKLARGPHQGSDEGCGGRRGSGVRRHSGVDDAGDPLHSTRWTRQLCGRSARRRTQGRGVVLRSRSPSRRPRTSPPVSTEADRSGLDGKDPPRQGL